MSRKKGERVEPAFGIALIGVLIINIGVALLVVWAFAAFKSNNSLPGQKEDAREGAASAKTRKWAGRSGIAGTVIGVLLITASIAASDTA
ncbi:hypothetical protein QMY03_00880 [Arthrobacter sp. KFRI-F3372]|nr:hypothetical protein QMY03_00880 [Arthrobacter sp. KFRI-F3372]